MSEAVKWVRETVAKLDDKGAKHISMPIEYAKELLRYLEPGAIVVRGADLPDGAVQAIIEFVENAPGDFHPVILSEDEA
jgi:hypothetical protein